MPAATGAWAAREGIDLERLRHGLAEYSGSCDYTVLMDVDAHEVSTPVGPGLIGR